MDRSKEEVAQLRARCNDSWHLPELPQNAQSERIPLTRTGVDAYGRKPSLNLLLQVVEDTSLIEGVEPSSLAAAGDHLFLSISTVLSVLLVLEIPGTFMETQSSRPCFQLGGARTTPKKKEAVDKISEISGSSA